MEYELSGGPQDGAKVYLTDPKRIVSQLYVGTKSNSEGYIAWSISYGKQFPHKYLLRSKSEIFDYEPNAF